VQSYVKEVPVQRRRAQRGPHRQGSIRFSQSEHIDSEVVERLLKSGGIEVAALLTGQWRSTGA
jgi:hypothetical protein